MTRNPLKYFWKMQYYEKYLKTTVNFDYEVTNLRRSI